jgi:predicted membrane protein
MILFGCVAYVGDDLVVSEDVLTWAYCIGSVVGYQNRIRSFWHPVIFSVID